MQKEENEVQQLLRFFDFIEYHIYLQYGEAWLLTNRLLAKSAELALRYDAMRYPENLKLTRIVGYPTGQYYKVSPAPYNIEPCEPPPQSCVWCDPRKLTEERP